MAGDECCDNVSDDRTATPLDVVGDGGDLIGGGWISINELKCECTKIRNLNKKKLISLCTKERTTINWNAFETKFLFS